MSRNMGTDIMASFLRMPSATIFIYDLVITFIVLLPMLDGATASPDSVDIVNQMPIGGTITVHCQSRDNDLATHSLPSGQTYGFGFKNNFWGTTLFSCEFLSPSGQQAGFQVWSSQVRNDVFCYHCVWYVRPDGFYAMEKGAPVQPKFMHPW